MAASSLAQNSDSVVASADLRLDDLVGHFEHQLCRRRLASLGPVNVVVLGHSAALWGFLRQKLIWGYVTIVIEKKYCNS